MVLIKVGVNFGALTPTGSGEVKTAAVDRKTTPIADIEIITRRDNFFIFIWLLKAKRMLWDSHHVDRA